METKLNVDLSKYNVGNYSTGKGIGVNLVWYFVNYFIFRSYLFPIYSLKRFLLRIFGAKLGKGIVIKPGVNIKYPWLLEIDNYVWIGEGVWIDNLSSISIGSNVCISQGAMLLTGNHNYKKVSFDLMPGTIIIQDGVWVGAKSIVCPNVTCKTHSVLSVNSVAVSNLEPYSIYQGNPAIKIRDRIIEN
ncbi:MAG TPA: colanic acid biosynthesis acetyltransferase WcaF [Bacteroidales bacterium]|nr:colanic acid biosynthesis acetyltransferase WcaF [Bacteroidales bacterium]